MFRSFRKKLLNAQASNIPSVELAETKAFAIGCGAKDSEGMKGLKRMEGGLEVSWDRAFGIL